MSPWGLTKFYNNARLTPFSTRNSLTPTPLLNSISQKILFKNVVGSHPPQRALIRIHSQQSLIIVTFRLYQFHFYCGPEGIYCCFDGFTTYYRKEKEVEFCGSDAGC
jgi:hypothetical protein